MNVEIGTEAALFPEKEYINGIAVAVHIFRQGGQHVVQLCRFSSTMLRSRKRLSMKSAKKAAVMSLGGMKPSSSKGVFLMLYFRNTDNNTLLRKKINFFTGSDDDIQKRIYLGINTIMARKQNNNSSTFNFFFSIQTPLIVAIFHSRFHIYSGWG
jgi:hypothetical protein